MKKRIFAVLFILILCFACVLPVGAVSEQPRMVDNAGLLSDGEFADIARKLDEISERQQFDVVITTTNGTDGKYIRDFADDFYDYNYYGFGNNYDGCVLVVDMVGRDWWISTCGYGITALTDAGIDYIGDQITDDLSAGEYYDAFEKFADLCDEFVTQAKTGTPYDTGNLPKEPFRFFFCLLISVGIGFVISLIVTGVMKGKLKSVRRQTAAKDYLVPGSLNVTQSRDMFLYRNVTRRAKPKESSGSSTHTSSSGRSHGGGGGSF